MTTVAFCEIDEYCRKVLHAHWPSVPCYNDVRGLTARRLVGDGIGGIDLICGGFPCQDISLAGKGAGLEGERSGLWFEYRRLIEEIRPRWVVIENVAALRSRGLDTVLGQIAALGYDAEWHCIPASAVGAPHRRDRIWIIAHASGEQLRQQPGWRSGESRAGQALVVEHGETRPMAHADDEGLEGRQEQRPERERVGARGQSIAVSNANSEPQGRLAISWGECRQWLVEPNVGRVAHGVPARVDRLKALGNAVVPQIPELIGRAIMAVEHAA